MPRSSWATKQLHADKGGFKATKLDGTAKQGILGGYGPSRGTHELAPMGKECNATVEATTATSSARCRPCRAHEPAAGTGFQCSRRGRGGTPGFRRGPGAHSLFRRFRLPMVTFDRRPFCSKSPYRAKLREERFGRQASLFNASLNTETQRGTKWCAVRQPGPHRKTE